MKEDGDMAACGFTEIYSLFLFKIKGRVRLVASYISLCHGEKRLNLLGHRFQSRCFYFMIFIGGIYLV